VPGGAVHDEYGVRAGRDLASDFVDMRLHGVGVDPGRGDRRALSMRGANRAEQIGVFIALVGWLARPRPLARPLTNDTVLLANPGFVGEPEFDGCIVRHIFEMRLQRVREVFLNAAMVSAFWAGWRGRALI